MSDNILEIRDLVVQFCKMVNTQFSTYVKCIRIDNGKEFDMSLFYKSTGIIHQTSCPYTPQQNGVAEQKNRHLAETCRSMLHAKNVPGRF